MNEFMKVSIAGVSFNIENSAYETLKAYLDELETHYKDDSAGREIIADIEERIAELIIEKGGKDNIVTVAQIQIIIDILGKPSQIDDEGGVENEQEKSRNKLPKKLYRDIESKVLGGVCSGLSYYLKTDPVYIRLSFIGLGAVMILLGNIGFRCFFRGPFNWFTIPILLYLILWIVIPAAKSVAEICAMKGISQSLEDIEKSAYMNYEAKINNKPVSKSGKNFIGEIIGAIFRVILIIFGITLIITGIIFLGYGLFGVFGLKLYSGIPAMSAIDYIAISNINTLWIKILACIIYFIPCILAIYWGLKCCIKFKEPKWRPSLILLLSWIVLGAIGAGFGTIAAGKIFNRNYETIDRKLPKQYDTLYVKFANRPISPDAKYREDEWRKGYSLFYIEELEGKKGMLEFTKYPRLSIFTNHDSTESNPIIRYKLSTHRDGAIIPSSKGNIAINKIATIKDSLITVYPTTINREKKYDGTEYRINFILPKNVAVKIVDRDTIHDRTTIHNYHNYYIGDYSHKIEFGTPDVEEE